jgi:hypothetical protein
LRMFVEPFVATDTPRQPRLSNTPVSRFFRTLFQEKCVPFMAM